MSTGSTESTNTATSTDTTSSIDTTSSTSSAASMGSADTTTSAASMGSAESQRALPQSALLQSALMQTGLSPSALPQTARAEPRVALPKPTRTDRWGMNPEDRLRVMEACLLLQRRGWKMNFGLMMAMAAIVAGMGLAADSPALVIGAMLIAPLMTPVLGIAASIAMVLGEALIRSVITVTLATLGVIGLGFLVGLALPGDLMQSSEVLARTSPDIKDLVVAVAAGLAGSYATARPDMSSSLPGVAVAVALVPPLMVVGITAEAGEYALSGGARGALLLYLTNLAGIVTLATIVFIATGFVPAARLARIGPRVVLGILVGMALVVAVAVPLLTASIQAARDSDQNTIVQEAVNDWNKPLNRVSDIVLDDSEIPYKINVAVIGLDTPDSDSVLELELEEELGEDVVVDVQWTQAQRASNDAVTFGPEAAEAIRPIVVQWIENKVADTSYTIRSFELIDNKLLIDVRSNAEGPAVPDLTAAIEAEFGSHPEVEVVWPSYIDVTSDELRRIAQEWAGENEMIVSDVGYDGARVSVDIVGPAVPNTDSLKASLAASANKIVDDIDVWFSQRVLVQPTPAPTAVVTVVPTPDPNMPWYEQYIPAGG